MTEEKTCYNCGNKNCIVYYSTAKKDCKRHYETYEYTNFECVNHDKWEEMKVEEIRTDNTEPLKNALERIAELEKEYASLKGLRKYELNVAKLEIEKLEKENAELKEKLKPENCLKLSKEGYIKFTSDQLTKAKEIIEELYNIIPASMADYAKEPMEHARKFLTEEADECRLTNGKKNIVT